MNDNLRGSPRDTDNWLMIKTNQMPHTRRNVRFAETDRGKDTDLRQGQYSDIEKGVLLKSKRTNVVCMPHDCPTDTLHRAKLKWGHYITKRRF